MSAQFADSFLPGCVPIGMTYYKDHFPDTENAPRIVLAVEIEGQRVVQAILDTGTPWCIIDPLILEQSGIALPVLNGLYQRLMVRGTMYEGRLLTVRIGIQADQGEPLYLEATTFVPILSSEEAWVHPNFLGLDGFLSRIRFAVDPTENAFYFGSI